MPLWSLNFERVHYAPAQKSWWPRSAPLTACRSSPTQTGCLTNGESGSAGKDNGILVLVAPSEKRVRIEVGYGLEPILPDGLAGEIIRTKFLPAFRRGDFADGVLAGARRVIEIVDQNHAVTADERDQLRTAQKVEPPWILISCFIGLFVVVGGFFLGLGLGTRTLLVLFFGLCFSMVDFLMLLLIPLPSVGQWSLRALGLGMVVWGFLAGRKRAGKIRPQASSGLDSDSSGWTSGASSGSSDSGGSSGGDFGGGSSGGGGASGSW